MSNFRYFSSQLLQEAQVFIQLFILPNFRCLSSQFPQEAPVPPASDIYAEVSHKKWGGDFGNWFPRKYCFWKTEIYFWQITWQFCKQKYSSANQQRLLFADKQNCEKIFRLEGKNTHHQILLADKKYFCNKILWFAIQNIFVTKYSGLQAKNWAGELISGQTRAGKILVKYTILDLLHMRKIGVAR